MQLSHQILVLEKNQPFQYCYNATLPYLYSACDPSKSFYCSLKKPEYGCTKREKEACIDFHFCNTPTVVICLLVLTLVIVLVLLLSGCFWCCCCCCCGTCCQRTCPCFAGMNAKSQRDRDRPRRITPLNSISWNMYEGLDQIQKVPPRHYASPTAPRTADL